MTKTMPLAEFAAGKTQQHVADILGVTQGGLRKMLFSGRNIHVNEHEDGTIEAFEIRKVPATKNSDTAA